MSILSFIAFSVFIIWIFISIAFEAISIYMNYHDTSGESAIYTGFLNCCFFYSLLGFFNWIYRLAPFEKAEGFIGALGGIYCLLLVIGRLLLPLLNFVRKFNR